MAAATPNEPGLAAYAVAVNKVAAATGRCVNCSKNKYRSKRDNQISRVPVMGAPGCGGVTHGDARSEDKVVELGGNRPYGRVVEIKSEVWPEVGVNRRDRVELGQVRCQNIRGPVTKQPVRTKESSQDNYYVQGPHHAITNGILLTKR